MKRVLVTDGASAAALAVVRSLGRRGFRVEVADPDPRARARRSRYAAASHICPDPGRDPSAFQAWACAQRVDLVIPATDLSLVPLLAVRDALPGRLAAAPTAAVEVTLSKYATARHADARGIPSPRTQLLPADDVALPAVIKPDRSKVWTEHGVEHLSVAHAQTPAELADHAARLARFGPVVAQARVPGDIVAIAALAHEGETLAAFQYRRLHQVPTTGGASSYRMSERIDPDLAAHVDRFLAPLGWTGVAMFEFKVAGDDAWLIEVNGRFWGSLALPIAAGADFPAWLAELLLHDRRIFPGYRSGVRCRTLTGEVAWWKAVARRDPGAPGVARALVDTVRALDPAERWDGYTPDDPLPALDEAAAVALGVANSARRGVRRRLVEAQLQARHRLRPWRGARSVLFVCDGNIIRSVYAAALYGARYPGVEVRGAGLRARAGRRPDPHTVAHAATRGLDVARHGATGVDRALLDAADVVFVMTLDQALRLRDRFGDHPRLVRLDAVDIDDPDGCADPAFARAFAQLDAALDALEMG